MSTIPEPSLTGNIHRMVNNSLPTIVPCSECGAVGTVHTRETSPRYAVQCPNRRRHNDTQSAKAKGCGNTATHYRAEMKKAIYYWNTMQMGVQKHTYNAILDTKNAGTGCLRCGLRGEHVCLYGQGWQRIVEPGAASARVRMGG